jgi:hypothetical protein
MAVRDSPMRAWRRVSAAYEELRSLIGRRAEGAYFAARDERLEPMHILWRLEDAIRQLRRQDDEP